MTPLRPFRSTGFWLVVVCALSSACGAPEADTPPSIAFTTIPAAAEGGPDALTTIAGRVVGARPGHRIVLFAKSGVWWVQPLAEAPFTTIQSDGSWKSTTHFGFEYAALLVDAGFRPPATIDTLPEPGGAVLAVSATKGSTTTHLAPKTLHFSGYDWEVRQSVSERGGSYQVHDPSNAWTDADGFLHLRIARREESWTNAEVTLTRSLGYGTYVFVVQETGHLAPAAVLGLFTWDPSGTDPNHREMALEITRWGDPASKNAQFVVQPYYVPANVTRFIAPAGVLTHSLRWTPGRAHFKTVQDRYTGGRARALAEHEFTSGVPAPGGEAVRMNLYVFGHAKHPLEKGTEVVIEQFLYLP